MCSNEITKSDFNWITYFYICVRCSLQLGHFCFDKLIKSNKTETKM